MANSNLTRGILRFVVGFRGAVTNAAALVAEYARAGTPQRHGIIVASRSGDALRPGRLPVLRCSDGGRCS
jgi:hypothetical protein